MATKPNGSSKESQASATQKMGKAVDDVTVKPYGQTMRAALAARKELSRVKK